jgi:hypothetical protein
MTAGTERHRTNRAGEGRTGMPEEAQREAEKTNLPVLATQLARFRHRLEYWIKREEELDHKKAG